MSDNYFRNIREQADGAAAGRRHPSVNENYDARLGNTSRIEGYQGYMQPSRTYDVYQESQAPSSYTLDAMSRRPEDAYSSGLVDGHHPARHQQHMPWLQRAYQGMDAPLFSQTRGTFDDQSREIGGQFGTPVVPSGPVHEQQGTWNSKKDRQGVDGIFVDRQPGVYSYEILPVAEWGIRYHPDCPNANVSQPKSNEGHQQSMLMASLGRQPGYEEQLLRAMGDIPLNPMGSPTANGIIDMSRSASAGNGDSANVIQLHEHGSYPLLHQYISRNGVVPGITLSRPEDSGCWDRQPQTSLTPASQSPGRPGPQLPGCTKPSSGSVVVGDALRCSHEGCKAEFKKSWGKGNLARHLRMKHKNGGRCYICEANGCALVFQRSDARLRHYRKKHPELVKGPMRPRKASSSTGTRSGLEHPGSSPYNSSLASPGGSQALDDFETASSSYKIDSESYQVSLFRPIG